jgi:hypothetical protein
VDVPLASGRASVQVASAAEFQVEGQALAAGTYAVTPGIGQIAPASQIAPTQVSTRNMPTNGIQDLPA